MKTKKASHLDEIRTRAIAEALKLGLPPETFMVTWDEAPRNVVERQSLGTRLAVATEIKLKGKPVHQAIWHRLIETRGGKKPKTVRELEDTVAKHIEDQHAQGYGHLFPQPDEEAIFERYRKIQTASPEEAAEYPESWRQIRRADPSTLRSHVRYLCRQLTDTRTKIVKEAADYLIEEMRKKTYTPSEVCELLSNYGKAKWLPNGEVQKITKENEAMPNELTARDFASIIEMIRAGKSGRDAFRETIKAAMPTEASANEKRTGWETFERSSSAQDGAKLYNAAGNTNWCTGASKSTAGSQLKNGNFYIYWKDGVAQIAIRTEGNKVAEVRGRGQGQTIPTEELREVAEEFLLSGKGPEAAEDYLWDQKFRKACTVFNNTGVREDILLEAYDQNGKFEAKPKAGGYGQTQFEEEYIGNLKRRLEKEEIERVDPDGTRHLLTSYNGTGEDIVWKTIKGSVVIKGETKIEIPTESIGGSLLVEAPVTANALKTVGGKLVIRENGKKSAKEGEEELKLRFAQFEAPALLKIQELEIKQARVNLDNLTEAGNITIRRAGGLAAPKLRKANRVDDCAEITYFPRASLEEIAYLKTSHPEGYTSLKSVGNMVIKKLGKISMPSVKKAGNISVKGSSITFENLTSAGKMKMIAAVVSLPKLKEAGEIVANDAIDFEAGKLKSCTKVTANGRRKVNLESLEEGSVQITQARTVRLPSLRKSPYLNLRVADKALLGKLEEVGYLNAEWLEDANLPSLKKAERMSLKSAFGISCPKATEIGGIMADCVEEIELGPISNPCHLYTQSDTYTGTWDLPEGVIVIGKDKEWDQGSGSRPVLKGEEWEEAIVEALNTLVEAQKSGSTGNWKCPPCLLPAFNQRGEFTGKIIHPSTGAECIIEEPYQKALEAVTLDPSQILRIDQKGLLHLKTSLVVGLPDQLEANPLGESRKTCSCKYCQKKNNAALEKYGRTIGATKQENGTYLIPYYTIAGHLENPHKDQKIEAPTLRSIFGRLETDGPVEAKGLTFVGGDLTDRAEEAEYPALVWIGGEMRSTSPVLFVPKLRHTAELVIKSPGTVVHGNPKESRESVSISGKWQAKLEGETITLNAAALSPEEVASKIRHELGHMAWRDPKVRLAFEKLWEATPEKSRREIEKTVGTFYPDNEHREEALVRAFEQLAKDAPRDLLRKFMAAIQKFWAELTQKISGKAAMRPSDKEIREITASIIEAGAKMLREKKIHEPEEALVPA
jgi:hypothetical protein